MSAGKVKYKMEVVEIGPLVSDFIENNMLVFFQQGSPDELREIAILHTHTELHHPITPGDTFVIDQDSFKVLAVGEVANDNLANLGHLVVKFNGETEPEMPGDVCVEAKPIPSVQTGTVIKIVGN